MPNNAEPLIFDGHNDVLFKLALAGGRSAVASFSEGRGGDIDLPRGRQAGFAGGFFALFVRSSMDPAVKERAMQASHYDLPLPDPVAQKDALPDVLEQVALLLDMQAQGMVKICRSTADIRACMDSGQMAAILHMEGAEAIDADLYTLDVLHAAGLRSLGPVWSRKTIFGEGVPFRYPSTGDIGAGLTETGKALLRRCNEKRILFDLSHLNEAGFWDVARLSDAPLIATHSNTHAVAPHSRNLTDDQLRAIADSDGLVGLNFGVAFLRPDGQLDPQVSLDIALRHLDHLIKMLGEDRVALGSDFDGAKMPTTIGDVTGLNGLRAAMRDHGYDEGLMRKICHENWLNALARTWDEPGGEYGGEQAET